MLDDVTSDDDSDAAAFALEEIEEALQDIETLLKGPLFPEEVAAFEARRARLRRRAAVLAAKEAA